MGTIAYGKLGGILARLSIRVTCCESVPVFPSPKVHVKVMGSPSGSEDPTALNVMGLQP